MWKRAFIVISSEGLPTDGRPLPASQQPVHLLHARSFYAWRCFPCLPLFGEQTRKPLLGP